MGQLNSVLIITAASGVDEDRLEDVCARLKAGRLNAVVRSFDGKTVGRLPAQAPTIIVLDFPDAIPGNLKALTKRLKSVYKSAPSLAACLPAQSAGDFTALFNTTVLHPAHASQLATRVISLSRLQIMETEMTMRIATLSETFNAPPAALDPSPRRRIRVLFVGSPSPRFMAIVSALQDSDAEVIAAFTGFTAFDYLHEQNFDAVVLNAITSEEPAFTISSTMRRNSKLFHTPTLILTGRNKAVNIEQAYRKGASDVIADDAPAGEIRDRILEQANFHSIHEDMKGRFSGLGNRKTMDAATGLFNPDFFDAHLERHKRTSRLVPVAIFTITSKDGEPALPEDRLTQACVQVGSMLRNLVRMQDCTARLDTNCFAVLFPSVSLEDANFAAGRISSIIGSTGLKDEAGSYGVTAQVTVTNVAAAHMAAEAITA